MDESKKFTIKLKEQNKNVNPLSAIRKLNRKQSIIKSEGLREIFNISK